MQFNKSFSGLLPDHSRLRRELPSVLNTYMKTLRKLIGPTAFAASVILLSGCTTTHKQTFVHAQFSPDKIDRIAVLPLIDSRIDPKRKDEFRRLADHANMEIVDRIKMVRHYPAFFTTNVGNVADYSTQRLPTGDDNRVDTEWLRQLGPSKANWILVPLLGKIGGYNVGIGTGANTSLTLFLFNKQTGNLWLKSSVEVQSSAFLLTSVIVAGMGNQMKEKGIVEHAAGLCVATIPEVKAKNIRSDFAWVSYARQNIEQKSVNRIVVMPPIDGRRRISQKMEFTPEIFQREIVKALKDRGYACEPSRDTDFTPKLSKDEMYLADSALLQKIGPSDAQYVLVPIIDDLGEPGIWKHFETTFFLFDKTNGEVIWEGSGWDTTIEKAMEVVKQSFPKRKKA